jgi:hypothetical protein
MLQGPDFSASLAFSLPAHWLGVRPTQIDWLNPVEPAATKTAASLESGVWGLEFSDLAPGDKIVVAARFSPQAQATDSDSAAARAAADPLTFAANVERLRGL